MTDTIDLSDVQGWVLRGYRMDAIRHLALHITDRDAARRWIAATVAGDADAAPQVQSAAAWDGPKPPAMFNLAFTAAGLGALGVDVRRAGFERSFVEGIATDERAMKLGDYGESAPQHWLEPYRPDAAMPIHIVATIHGADSGALDSVSSRVPSRAFRELARHDGYALPDDKVHFGYRDNISNPRIRQVHSDELRDEQPWAPPGVVLLGYPNAFEGLSWRVPHEIGFNGTYNAFRILRQEIDAFDAYLDREADRVLASPVADELLPPGWDDAGWPAGTTRHGAMVEILAAKLCGRWRNGNSLARHPRAPEELDPLETRSAFDYADDADGQRCPLGSHVRRNNPRSTKLVQRYANHTRRIVRRGMPYGPPSGPGERGLLGNFIGASISAQFEAIQNDWMNLGLQDPRITGTNDPVLGANDPANSRFSFPVGEHVVHLRGFPRFVTTRAGAYTFIPSMSALRKLGA